MKHTVLLFGVLLLAGGCSASEDRPLMSFLVRKPPKSPAVADERFGEESTFVTVPREHLGRFLQRLAALVDESIPPRQVRRIDEALSEMARGDNRSFKLSVAFEGRQTPLEIQVFLDDPQAPQLYFFTSPELVTAIDELSAGFDAAMDQREPSSTPR